MKKLYDKKNILEDNKYCFRAADRMLDIYSAFRDLFPVRKSTEYSRIFIVSCTDRKYGACDSRRIFASY